MTEFQEIDYSQLEQKLRQLGIFMLETDCNVHSEHEFKQFDLLRTRPKRKTAKDVLPKPLSKKRDGFGSLTCRTSDSLFILEHEPVYREQFGNFLHRKQYSKNVAYYYGMQALIEGLGDILKRKKRKPKTVNLRNVRNGSGCMPLYDSRGNLVAYGNFNKRACGTKLLFTVATLGYEVFANVLNVKKCDITRVQKPTGKMGKAFKNCKKYKIIV
jgi:hypothetical protein